MYFFITLDNLNTILTTFHVVGMIASGVGTLVEEPKTAGLVMGSGGLAAVTKSIYDLYNQSKEDKITKQYLQKIERHLLRSLFQSSVDIMRKVN